MTVPVEIIITLQMGCPSCCQSLADATEMRVMDTLRNTILRFALSTMDALETFRAAVSAKYDIKPVNASGAPASSLRSATHLRLSTAATFPKNTPTRLRKVGSSATDPASEPDGFFMLEAVYLAWLSRDTPGGEYMKQAREHGFPAGGFVGLTERKGIVDWLKRAVTVLDSIVPLSGMFLIFDITVHLSYSTPLESTTPPGSPPPSVFRHLPTPSSSVPHAQTLPSTSTRSRGDAGPASSPPKRRYVPDAADVEVVKKIRQSEVELRDHNTVLRGIKNNVTFHVLFHGTTHADVLIELFFRSECVCCQAQKPERGQKDRGSGTHCNTDIRYRCLLPSHRLGLWRLMIPCFKILKPRLVNKVRDRFPIKVSRVTICAENMYPIIMISSSPTSLITMYNVRRFLQESMHVLSSLIISSN